MAIRKKKKKTAVKRPGTSFERKVLDLLYSQPFPLQPFQIVYLLEEPASVVLEALAGLERAGVAGFRDGWSTRNRNDPAFAAWFGK